MQNREAQYLPHVFGSQVPHGQLDLVLFVVSIRSLDDHGDVVGRHCSSFKACIHKCVGPLRLRSLRLSSRSPGGMLHRNTLSQRAAGERRGFRYPCGRGGGPTEVVSDMSASARAGRVYRARMAWSLATRPPYPFVVVQRGPDRPLERHNREGLVQKGSPRSLPNPIVMNLLGAIGGHQENLYLRPDGPDVRRELESALERHHHIRQE